MLSCGRGLENSSLRIVLLNQYYAPDEAASSQLLTDLGTGLAAAGHDVIAICGRRAYADPSLRYASIERIEGVEVRRAWATGFGRGSKAGRLVDYMTFLAGACLRLMTTPKPDLVISLSTPPMVSTLGWLGARLRGARSFYWVMDVYPDLAFELGALNPRSPAGRLFSAVTGMTLRRSDAVIALGDNMAGRLRSAGVERLATIHNWADEGAIPPGECGERELRWRWSWQDRLVVMYSGNMGLAHEFDTVLAAAAILQDRPEVLFAFIGDGPRRREVEEQVRSRGLRNVCFKPYVQRDRLCQSLKAGDLHLITLRDRMPGLLVPSKIYGILAAGRPTLYIGPDEGEISDIVEAGRCGARVAIGGAEAVAREILRYAEDENLRQEQGRRARELFEERYTKEQGLKAFIRLIERCAAGGTTWPSS
jgi:glycosyltransferase involved in cell wall biosynthesis